MPEPDRAEGANTGHENGEAMASVGVRLTAQLGCDAHYKNFRNIIFGKRIVLIFYEAIQLYL